MSEEKKPRSFEEGLAVGHIQGQLEALERAQGTYAAKLECEAKKRAEVEQRLHGDLAEVQRESNRRHNNASYMIYALTIGTVIESEAGKAIASALGALIGR